MVRTATTWRGALNFGLVNINVELYSAVKSHSLGFNLLHKKCNTPINYKRWCPRCHQEVEWEEVVKGLKLEDGSYFVLTKELLNKLKPTKTDYINIIEFVDSLLVSPIYFDQHYYIAPSKETDKAFFLFAQTLEYMNKLAIGQFVMRDKQYICAIQPYQNALLLTTLNYSYEIKSVKKIEELKRPKFEKEELKLAEQLINKLTVKKFDIARFRDTFAEQLLKTIKAEAKGKRITGVKKVKSKELKDVSLIEALKQSLKTKNNVEVKAKAR